jgi:hypothetical protein
VVTVTISNLAENMTEEQTKRMFDRFYRADSSRASSGGFGIGLAMAQAIVTSHNGKISAELSEDKVLSISASFPTQYGSFRLITNFVEKQPKNVNNNSQNSKISKENKISIENGDFEKIGKNSIGEIADTDMQGEEAAANLTEDIDADNDINEALTNEGNFTKGSDADL